MSRGRCAQSPVCALASTTRFRDFAVLLTQRIGDFGQRAQGLRRGQWIADANHRPGRTSNVVAESLHSDRFADTGFACHEQQLALFANGKLVHLPRLLQQPLPLQGVSRLSDSTHKEPRAAPPLVGPLHWRPPMHMKGRHNLQSPRLALLALLLRPHDRLLVWREDEARAGSGDLETVPTRLVGVEEEGLLDGVLVRPRLDEHVLFEADVGRAQHLFTAVDGVGDVMEEAARAGVTFDDGDVVRLVVRQPHALHQAGVENDLLNDLQPRCPFMKSRTAFGLTASRFT